jgi:hypothetical protein
MRHDQEDLKWLIPSIFVVMMLGWQATEPGRAATSQAIHGLTSVFEGSEALLAYVVEHAYKIDVIPQIPSVIAQWLVPLLIGSMIVVSTINALRHQALAKPDRPNNRHKTPTG